jgi:surface-anchored protein
MASRIGTLQRVLMLMLTLTLVLMVGWVGGLVQASPGEERVMLRDEHVDLRARYDATRTPALDLVVMINTNRVYLPNEAVLVGEEVARLELPSDLPPLGLAGDSLWVLPASDLEGVIHLGFSGEGLPSGVFAEPMKFRLVAMEGPGHFFLWQAGSMGDFQFFMSTRDGIGSDDFFPQSVGGHSHANWGFTTSGVYHVTFEASTRRVGETTNLVSAPDTFTFHVLPLPEVVSGFAAWQELHWPGVTEEAVIGETADPDGDGRVNLWEYALGLNPKVADAEPAGAPRLQVEWTGTGQQVEVSMPRSMGVSDVAYELYASGSVGGPWLQVEGWLVEEEAEEGWRWVRWRGDQVLAAEEDWFYRVGVRRNIEP